MRDLFIATKKSKFPQKQVVVSLKKEKKPKLKEVFSESLLKIWESRLKSFWDKFA